MEKYNLNQNVTTEIICSQNVTEKATENKEAEIIRGKLEKIPKTIKVIDRMWGEKENVEMFFEQDISDIIPKDIKNYLKHHPKEGNDADAHPTSELREKIKMFVDIITDNKYSDTHYANHTVGGAHTKGKFWLEASLDFSKNNGELFFNFGRNSHWFENNPHKDLIIFSPENKKFLEIAIHVLYKNMFVYGKDQSVSYKKFKGFLFDNNIDTLNTIESDVLREKFKDIENELEKSKVRDSSVIKYEIGVDSSIIPYNKSSKLCAYAIIKGLHIITPVISGVSLNNLDPKHELDELLDLEPKKRNFGEDLGLCWWNIADTIVDLERGKLYTHDYNKK